MLDTRSRALTLHYSFQVPLDGTALTLGILGALAGGGIVFVFEAAGLNFNPLGPIYSHLLRPVYPKGFVFTCWVWMPPVHWAVTLLVELGLWAVVGVAICRTVVSRVAEHEPMGVRTALAFAVSQLARSLGFVAVILGLLFALSLPVLIPTLVGRIPAVGSAAGTALYLVAAPFLFLLALIAVAVLLAGVPAGYLFLPAALAAREGPFLDCVAKAIGYAFARPFLFLWDLFKLALFAYCIYYLGTGILPWMVKGMPTLYGLLPGAIHPAALSELAIQGQKVVLIVIRMLAGGFVAAYVFGAGTLIYLNMRLEVDGVPFAEPASPPAEA